MITLDKDVLMEFEGTFELQGEPPLIINTKIKADTLKLFIPDYLENGISLIPSYEDLFFATQRPWEINFKNKDSIIITSWGQKTVGIRK